MKTFHIKNMKYIEKNIMKIMSVQKNHNPFFYNKVFFFWGGGGDSPMRNSEELTWLFVEERNILVSQSRGIFLQ